MLLINENNSKCYYWNQDIYELKDYMGLHNWEFGLLP